MAENTNNRVWAASTPGVRHDPDDARRNIFQDTGGVTGMVAAGGGDVGTTPGTPMSVRLFPCSVVARSTYSGRSDESYSFAVKDPVDVEIRTTGSGSGRTDIIAWVISDPVFEGETIAETDAMGNLVEGAEGIDPNDYDYWDYKVFENVPSSIAKSTDAFRDWVYTNDVFEGPVIPYAKVVQGKNSTSLDGKVQRFFDSVNGRKATDIVDMEVTKNYNIEGVQSSYATLGPELPFEVPWWATRVRAKATVQGVSLWREGGGNRNGRVSGLLMNTSMRQYKYYHSSNSAWGRETLMVWADHPVPPGKRGTKQNFRFRMTVNHANSRATLSEWSHMFLELEFLEDANAVDNSDPIED